MRRLLGIGNEDRKIDVQNRDVAIVYINGIFYEDATHAMCLKQFIDETGFDEDVNSLQFRPTHDVFLDISKQVGPVVLGHRVDAGNAIFLFCGYINEEVVEFNGITSDIIDNFKNHYNMEVLDELQYDGSLNDQYDEEEQWNKAHEKMDEASGLIELKNILINDYDFQKSDQSSSIDRYFNGYIDIMFGDSGAGTKNMVSILGGGTQLLNNEKTLDAVQNADSEMYETLVNMNGEISFELGVFKINFPNGSQFSYKPMIKKIIFDNSNKFDIDNLNIDKKDINFEDLERIIKLKKVAKNTRLKKLAAHDIMNRDCAIVMIGNEFYEDVTHAACLKQYLDKYNNDIHISNYQIRPDNEVFIEIATKEEVYVTLGHKAEKEDGVYLIYAIKPNGDMVEYNDIPQSIKDQFEDNYNLEVMDEMQHDGDYKTNNPYIDDAEEMENNLLDRMFELSGNKEIIDNLKNNGYEMYKAEENYFYANNGITIGYDMDLNTFIVCALGQDLVEVKPDKLNNFIENLKNEEKLKFLTEIHGRFIYNNDMDEIGCEFKNINGFNIILEQDFDGIHIFTISDLNDNDITSEIEDILENNGADSQNLQLNDLQFLYSYGGEE